MYSWYYQYKAGSTKPKELLKWFKMLSARDWVGLIFSVGEKKTWERVWGILRKPRASLVENIWPRAIQLHGISNIREFVDWAAKK